MSSIAKHRTAKNFAILNAMLTIALSSLVGCDHDLSVTANDEMLYRTIAWNYLGDRERATVIGDLTAAKVRTAQWQGKNVVSVRFNTHDDALLGPIIIYIDPQTKAVVGGALRF